VSAGRCRRVTILEQCPETGLGIRILSRVSVIALVMLVAAVALLAVAEWPRVVERTGLQERARARKRSHLRVVDPVEDDSDEFAKAVERDLASLPTFDPRAKRD
jgi:cytochrome c-type biogenesis protein CcmH/NrfG